MNIAKLVNMTIFGSCAVLVAVIYLNIGYWSERRRMTPEQRRQADQERREEGWW